MPEKTKAEFREDGFFITGDLGVIDDEGYVSIVGRGKDLVISGGFNVYPKEVEDEIDALPGVIESAVIGVAHPDFGEGVTAVVAKKRDAALDRKGRDRGAEGTAGGLQAAQARDVRGRSAAQQPWARCRRRCCARPTRTSTASPSCARPDRGRISRCAPWQDRACFSACRAATRLASAVFSFSSRALALRARRRLTISAIIFRPRRVHRRDGPGSASHRLPREASLGIIGFCANMPKVVA